MLDRIKSFRIPAGTEKYVVLFILVLWGIFRLTVYGDPALSIAGNDTSTYVEASRVPLFSAEMMTGRRLLTTNLLYKVFEPESGYEIIVNGSLETSRRVLQPGFDRIVILQLILTILGWGTLTWVISSHMKSFLTKILTALVIPAFAFTPQMADWDSILLSESMTFSLFALQFAILIFIVFSLNKDPNAKVLPWLICWGVVYFFWANLRDTNNYVAPILFGLSALTLFTPKFRRSKALIGVMIFTSILFILGVVTFQQSGRSLISTINVYISDIFPFPARVEFMKDLGMPEPETAEFYVWFEENGVSGMVRFLLAHPGYDLEKIVRDFPEAFKEIRQTYFHTPETKLLRARLIAFGETLHPETSAPFSMGMMLLLGILALAFANRTDTIRPWAWLGTFIFVSASIVIIPTILGDTWAINRHALFSTMIFRLSMWLFAIIVMDIALTRENPVNAQ